MTVPDKVSRGVRIAVGAAGLVLLVIVFVLLARDGVTPTTARLTFALAGFSLVAALTARDREQRKKLLIGATLALLSTGWVALVLR